jgi:lipopolysaccharide export system permease protein
MVSSAGHQEVAENGDRFVVLEQGRRYEVEPGTPAFKMMEFERYRVRTEDGEAKPTDRLPNRIPVNELILDDSNTARGELLWRVGLPISALVLALLAIPLSYVNPRAGRSANMVMAILVYVVYNNLMSVSQAWVAQGKISFWLGLFGVHALMLLPVLLLFYRRTVIRMPWQKRAS